MYKKLLLNLLFIGGSLSAFAQPSLTAANVSPAFADTFASVVCDTTGVVPGASGASQTWDFSVIPTILIPTTLTAAYDTGTVVAPSVTPGWTTLGTFIPTTTHAVLSPSTAVTNYYVESSSKLSSTGLYVNTTDYGAYSDPLDVLHFPFTYMSTFTDTYAGLVYFTPPSPAPPVLASEAGTVTVTADAYGTLKLPPTPPSSTAAVYTNVLRVHSTQAFRDSADLFGTPVVQTYTLETYTWYQPGYHSALLTISTATGFGVNQKVVSYASRQLANHEGVASIAGIDASLRLYPNPAQNLLNIEFDEPVSAHVRISMCDVLGREVAVISDNVTQGKQLTSYNTGSLPKGLYLVRLQSGTETVTRKVEIQ